MLGQRILTHWGRYADRFVKVMPVEYRRALELQRTGELKEAS